MERSPEEAAAPPLLLDDEGERRRAEANGFDLFVGNMGAEVDEAFLARVFSQFASFVPGSARAREADADGTTRCYGYVTFAERRDADAAWAEFDGRLVGTRLVSLSVCRRRSEEARRLSPEQLLERCEMRKRLFRERIRAGWDRSS